MSPLEWVTGPGAAWAAFLAGRWARLKGAVLGGHMWPRFGAAKPVRSAAPASRSGVGSGLAWGRRAPVNARAWDAARRR
jgi:hypothetical protein